MEKVAAILLMAGFSTRFSGPKNKQLCLLKGKPVFRYSIEAFVNTKIVSELIIVTNKFDKDEITKFVQKKKIDATIILGGKTRQESVSRGLKALKLKKDDIVIVHDGARPLVTKKDIIEVVKSAKKFGAATTYVESTDTVAINKKDEITSFVDRETIALIQTPQAFRYETLLKAHNKAKNNKATDDCSLILASKGKVKLVYGGHRLHKITTKEDIKYLEGFIK